MAVMVAVREAELGSHMKMVFADICMLRTGARLGNHSHFISNNHLHLMGSEAPQSSLPLLVAAATFSCVNRVAPG